MIIIECGDNKGDFTIDESGLINYLYYGETEKCFDVVDTKAVFTALRVFKDFLKIYNGPKLWAFVARPELTKFYARVAPCVELVNEDEAMMRHMSHYGML